MELNTADSNRASGDTGSMSLDASIKAAMDTHITPDTAETTVPSPSETAQEGQAATEDAPEVADQQTEATGDTAEPQTSDKPKVAPKATTSASLKTWTPAEKAAFEASPPEVQAAITRMVKNMEAGFTKKTQQLSQVRQQAEEMTAAFEPRHLEFLQSKGVSTAQAVKDMIALHDFWAQNPVDYVKHVMKVSGLTPQQIGLDSAAQTQPGQQPAGDPPPSAEPEWVDPAVVALRQQYEQDKQQLQRELASLRQTLTGAQEASAQEKVLSAQTIIDRFIDETDDSGEPAHPHFEAVQDHMERLLKHDPSISAMPPGPEKLQAAYDVATWMHPEARAARLEAESRTQQAIWEAQRTRAAATVKPKAAPAGGAATPKPTTLDAMIRQAASKFGI